MSIRMKMLIPMMALILVASILLLVSAVIIFSGFISTTAENSVIAYSNVVNSELNQRKERALLGAKVFSENEDVAGYIETKDQTGLGKVIAELAESIGMDLCTVTDADGVVLFRSHQPEEFGDNISSQPYVASAIVDREDFVSVEKGKVVPLGVYGSCPVYDDSGKLIGVVAAGFRLDTFDFVDEMQRIIDAEVTVFLGDTRLSTTVIGADGNRAVGTQAVKEVSEAVLSGQDYVGEAQVVGRDAFVKYVPIESSNKEVIGMLFVGEYVDDMNAQVTSFILISSAVVLAILLTALPIVLVLSKRIVAPIREMVEISDRLADGEVDFEFNIETKDEMNELALSFKRMIEHTKLQAAAISNISEGDLTTEVELASANDVMGSALQTMIETNNEVFQQIIGSANQVTLGARQIANGATSLAQGATEQSTVVTELSSSIAGIAEMARENSELASKASSLGETIRSSAESGSEQMGRMVQAVEEINQSSQAIRNVIKAIDDIAFQTNILALNAAVEAARAGQHGTGFAVVANEVRMLAAKSADAAKETTDLIKDSIDKAELGKEIARDTSEAFEGIVSGVSESGDLIGEIVSFSEKQRSAIEEINDGVGQVTLVVQQTSATAEESAAASEELSGQADILSELVSKFKIKE